MRQPGWKHGLDAATPFRGAGRYPIAAYSEFLPPVRLGRLPYGTLDPSPFDAQDPWGWPVDEFEEACELAPGLDAIARQVLGSLIRLGKGEAAHGISKSKLADNPYWPEELSRHAGALDHERYVILLPLALSKTQDDKGRRRWTLFGGSEQGPSRAFWRSFFTAPGQEAPGSLALDFFRRLLVESHGETPESVSDLHRAGFRILPRDDEGALPGWTSPFLVEDERAGADARFLLTFRPFGALPRPIRQSYLAGRLHLLPFPGSLLAWGIRGYQALAEGLPLAWQIPLLHLVARHEGPRGIRVPQSGWLHEPRPGDPSPSGHHGPMRNTFRRTHRNARVLRDVDELGVTGREDKLAHVLFSTEPKDIGLYGKPMARNTQIWSDDFRRVLDGPRATPEELRQAARRMAEGGLFGYRFQYPAMRLGDVEIYWQRPLVAFLSARTGEVTVLPEAPAGYLTAYSAARPDPSDAVEIWPRFLRRDPWLAALDLFRSPHDTTGRRTSGNVRKLLEAYSLLGERPLPRDFARQLLTLPRHGTLEGWLEGLPEHSSDPERGRALAEGLTRLLEVPPEGHTRPAKPSSLTFARTSRRSFEVAYWKTIDTLSGGSYLTKNNADCVLDKATQKALKHHRRDLDPLGEYLLGRHETSIARASMQGRAFAGSLPFQWRTDFSFPWMGGWLSNQEEGPRERDLLVMIPGRDRSRAVIMADHYDTAFRADRYENASGGNGPRIAAAGADDNCSATATLLLAAPIFLELSRAGRLGCDVWLVHLTGEEFPADCLGARHLCQQLVEGTLALDLGEGRRQDLSRAKIQGVYVLDMVAHNNDHDRDVFQIAPGNSRESFRLAYQAHQANAAWNDSTRRWNRGGSRRGKPEGRRSRDGSVAPAIAPHRALSGEVRPHDDPRSTLYNTDGQIFSDAGIPVVLFMENYDINRAGYHDSLDTMARIDLDYGAAVAAIAIEAVARAASEPPGTP